jgi:hypothetical protein
MAYNNYCIHCSQWKRNENIRNDSPELIHLGCTRNRLAWVPGFTRKSLQSFGTVESLRAVNQSSFQKCRNTKIHVLFKLAAALPLVDFVMTIITAWESGYKLYSQFLNQNRFKTEDSCPIAKGTSNRPNTNPYFKTLFRPFQSKPTNHGSTGYAQTSENL